MPSIIKEVTADGDVTTETSYLTAVTLTAGSDAATLVVKAGGSSGTTVLTLKAAANTSTPPGRAASVRLRRWHLRRPDRHQPHRHVRLRVAEDT